MESRRSWPHGYFPAFRKAAEEFYNVDKAIEFLNRPVSDGYQRWRCVLCGWALDVDATAAKRVGACCCGGCGNTTLRPIAEFSAR